jgi:hypothetical protein
MELIEELGTLIVSVLGLMMVARLSNAGKLPGWLENDALIGGLIGLLVSGIGIGLIGLTFAIDKLSGSHLIDTLLTLAMLAAIVALLAMTSGISKRAGTARAL